MSEEYLPLIERDGEVLRVTGKKPRSAVHGANAAFHATAIILAALPDGRLLLADKTEKQRRKGRATPPGGRVYDCFGGHMRYEDVGAQELAQGLGQDAFRRCAARELGEELFVRRGDGAWRGVRAQAARMVPVGFYTLENDHNKEYSWIYLYLLESYGPYRSQDTLPADGAEQTIAQPICAVTFDELLRLHARRGGAGDVLSDAVGRALDADGGSRLAACLRAAGLCGGTAAGAITE